MLPTNNDWFPFLFPIFADFLFAIKDRQKCQYNVEYKWLNGDLFASKLSKTLPFFTMKYDV